VISCSWARGSIVRWKHKVSHVHTHLDNSATPVKQTALPPLALHRYRMSRTSLWNNTTTMMIKPLQQNQLARSPSFRNMSNCCWWGAFDRPPMLRPGGKPLARSSSTASSTLQPPWRKPHSLHALYMI